MEYTQCSRCKRLVERNRTNNGLCDYCILIPEKKKVIIDIEKLQSENFELKSELQDEIFKHAKLQFAYDMLSDKFLRLEEQIEKMKTCDNCSSNCRKRAYYHILNCPDWKFRG